MILSHGVFSQWLLFFVVSLQPWLHPNEIRNKINRKMLTLHTRSILHFICVAAVVVVVFFPPLTVIKAKLSEFRIATGEIMFAVHTLYSGTNLSETQMATQSFCLLIGIMCNCGY